ncbi:DnaJ-class molecular chaperone [Bacillus ectoiniformans]|uniref:hypothetical protein n=1 Tax=Bacillus ectoiniformans TaxID=1494429 RepID=UPI001956554F|nr:hypothetical protein [Bacillus ectoiniformans]MBM7649818.1 DnaJ-class molecular chaperone [Bacillus ectoiniformans]
MAYKRVCEECNGLGRSPLTRGSFFWQRGCKSCSGTGVLFDYRFPIETVGSEFGEDFTYK